MKIALLLYLFGSANSACLVTVTLNDVPGQVREYATVYADCINSQDGLPQEIEAKCGDLRKSQYDAATSTLASGQVHDQLEYAFRWLDKMIIERSSCHTHIKVKS